MPTDHIVTLLLAERDKLTRAIEALQGVRRRGRPPKNPLAVVGSIATPATPNGRTGGMTAAARKAQSRRMKAYWAKKKASKKG